MEVSVQPSGDNYSDSRGENIAEMVDLGRPGGGGAVGPYYPRWVCPVVVATLHPPASPAGAMLLSLLPLPPVGVWCSGYMDRMTLCGSTAVPPERVGRYALGVLRAGELHLTPLCGAVQVRPSYEFLVHKAAGERRTRQAAARSGK